MREDYEICISFMPFTVICTLNLNLSEKGFALTHTHKHTHIHIESAECPGQLFKMCLPRPRLGPRV